MCGILAIVSKTLDLNYNKESLIRRGPDTSQTHVYIKNGVNVLFDFHRLAINGLTPEGDQPFSYSGLHLICNGEIYNYKEIKQMHNIKTTSGSDCEVILPLFYKILQEDKLLNLNYDQSVIHLCSQLNGEWAFVIYDSNNNKIIAARDKPGVKPLYVGLSDNTFAFSSMIDPMKFCDTVSPMVPGSYTIIELASMERRSNAYGALKTKKNDDSLSIICEKVKHLITNAVKKRVINSDVPVGCLLSGGLDSSIVSAIAKTFCPNLRTFAIGLKDSVDLVYAKKVADFIGSNHTTIVCAEAEFLDVIPEVIRSIESYDITTVRASVGNYLVSKYIKANTDIKVLLCGDFADECFAGYDYFKKATPEQAQSETLRLLSEIYLFDSLRSDRCAASNGLEVRVPYSDIDLIEYYLSIPIEYRMGKLPGLNATNIEKYIVRSSFPGLLPSEVQWRPKTTFSDGVGSQGNQWHKIIISHTQAITGEEFEKRAVLYPHNTPETKEAYYYRFIFESLFPNRSNVIPFMWMPKFTESKDPSAWASAEFDKL